MDSELKSVQLESVTAGAGGSAPGASRRRPRVNLNATLAIPRSRELDRQSGWPAAGAVISAVSGQERGHGKA